MKWNKFTIKTTTAAEDYLSAMLDELGIEGIEIDNNIPLTQADMSDMFIDFPPELPPDDGISYVSFYLEDGADHSGLLKQVMDGIEWQRQFVDVGEGSIAASDTEDLDWINNWKEYFHSFHIENIVIKPTWEALKEEDKDRILIEIDPGISFGTGKHETTQLCIRQLCRYIPKVEKPNVLDVGCGSGILSIAALKLGADSVTGTDLDENCIRSTVENMAVNHLPKELGRFYVGNLIDDLKLQEMVGLGCYDVVAANILADVIIPMAPVIFKHLKQDGVFISSGIIDFKEQEVKEAIEQTGMKILEIGHQGEWVSITAVKE